MKQIRKLGMLVIIQNETAKLFQEAEKLNYKSLNEIIDEQKSFKITRLPEVKELPNIIINDKGNRSVIPKDFYKKNKKNSSKK